jgi:hypothetical protein
MVHVNGSLQWRGDGDQFKKGAFELPFDAPIVLGKATGNHIVLELPGMAATRAELTVDCTRPEPIKRWLHVLIIGPGENPKETAKLEGQVLKTVGGVFPKPGVKGMFNRPGFDRGRLHPTLAGDVIFDHIRFSLYKIEKEIRIRAGKKMPNDVVLLYFIGGEVAGDVAKGPFLTSTHSEEPLINRQKLEKSLSAMRGVKILILDIAHATLNNDAKVRAAREQVSRLLRENRNHAVLSVTWHGKGTMPAEVHLINVLRYTLPNAENLGQVETEARKRLSNPPRDLVTELQIPPALIGLRLRD